MGLELLSGKALSPPAWGPRAGTAWSDWSTGSGVRTGVEFNG